MGLIPYWIIVGFCHSGQVFLTVLSRNSPSVGAQFLNFSQEREDQAAIAPVYRQPVKRVNNLHTDCPNGNVPPSFVWEAREALLLVFKPLLLKTSPKKGTKESIKTRNLSSQQDPSSHTGPPKSPFSVKTVRNSRKLEREKGDPTVKRVEGHPGCGPTFPTKGVKLVKSVFNLSGISRM